MPIHNITPDLAPRLHAWFSARVAEGEYEWPPGTTCSLSDATTFTLDQRVVARYRKPGKTGFCFEWAGKLLGTPGGYASVYLSDGGLRETGTKSAEYRISRGKRQRVIKIQDHFQTHSAVFATKEYAFGSMAGHLNLRFPAISAFEYTIRTNTGADLPGEREIEVWPRRDGRTLGITMYSPQKTLISHLLPEWMRCPSSISPETLEPLKPAILAYLREKGYIRDHRSFLCMDRQPGVDLLAIISAEREDPAKRLSVNDRFEITDAILKAMWFQVTGKGLIHRDIKPENMIVSKINGWFVSFIDYAFAMRLEFQDGMRPGTHAYAAPEMLHPGSAPQTVGTDIFSLGRVLALLWGTITFPPTLQTLFHDIDELPPEFRTKIRDILEGMLRKKPEDRSSLESITTAFSQVHTEWLAYRQPSSEPDCEPLFGYRDLPPGLKKSLQSVADTADQLSRQSMKDEELHQAATLIREHVRHLLSLPLEEYLLQAPALLENVRHTLQKCDAPPRFRLFQPAPITLRDAVLAWAHKHESYMDAPDCALDETGRPCSRSS